MYTHFCDWIVPRAIVTAQYAGRFMTACSTDGGQENGGGCEVRIKNYSILDVPAMLVTNPRILGAAWIFEFAHQPIKLAPA